MTKGRSTRSGVRRIRLCSPFRRIHISTKARRPAIYERTLANALADHPDFHIDLGDTFMTDKYPNFKDALPQYYAQRYYFGRIAHSAPLFLVLGNHDGERLDRYDGTADCMAAWSCLTRKKLFPNPTPDGFYSGNTTELKPIGSVENYYAWEWGDALFVVLDPFWATNRRGRNRAEGNWTQTLGEPQYRWLQATLARSRRRSSNLCLSTIWSVASTTRARRQ